MTSYATRLESGKDTAVRMRLSDTLPLMPAGALRGRTGLRPDGGGAVTVVNGTMTVRVSPMLGWIDGPVLAQGGYPFITDATPTTGEALVIDPGDATGDRIDTIVARVEDNVYDSSGFTRARVYAVKGSPATGAPPVLPAGVIALRDITVPANRSTGNGGLAAANLGTDRRVYTTALGGICPVATTAEANALPYKYRGMYVDNAETGRLERWNGTAWVSAEVAQPACTMRSNVNQQLVNATTGDCNLGETLLDRGGMADANRMVVKRAGLYRAWGQVNFLAPGTAGVGYRRAGLVMGGETVYNGVDANTSTGLDTQAQVSLTLDLAVGAVVRLQAFHTYTAAVNTGGAGTYRTILTLERVAG